MEATKWNIRMSYLRLAGPEEAGIGVWYGKQPSQFYLIKQALECMKANPHITQVVSVSAYTDSGECVSYRVLEDHTEH